MQDEMCQEIGGDKVSGFFFGGVDDLWRMGVNVSVMSLEHSQQWS